MSYSIDWPIGFQSRATNPLDTCYVGSKGAEKRKANEPTKQSQAPWADPSKKPAMQAQRLRVGTNVWKVYDLLRRTGTLPRSAIACNLQMKPRALDEATLALVRVGVLDRQTKKGKQSSYSIGKTPVVEVQK